MKFTVSYGENIKRPNEIFEYRDVKELLDTMRYEHLQHFIEDLRGCDKREGKKIKEKLPYIVASHFSTNNRNTSCFSKSNGLILDLDGLDDIKYWFNLLKKEIYTHFLFISPSGNGLKLGIKFTDFVRDAKIYSLVYRKCAESFTRHYKIATDKTSDAARACFLSYDPDFYYNPDSALWKPTYEEPKRSYNTQYKADDDDLARLESICKEIYINDYHDWVTAGLALKTLGEEGRHFFRLLSLNKGGDDDVDSVDRKFDSFSVNRGLTIASFYHVAQKYKKY